MGNQILSVVSEIQLIESLFDDFNSAFFESALSRPVITFNTDTTKGAYGWFTTEKVWKDFSSGFTSHEINISCDRLESPEHICSTLLHEMVHLYNFLNGIKDTSRSGTYHNSNFRDSALSHGLLVDFDSKYGFCKTSLSPLSLSICSDYFPSFSLARKRDQKEKSKSKSSTRKYVCPFCGISVRATKDVEIACVSCSDFLSGHFVLMVKED